MASGWKEMWSVGSGSTRRYCGIARTEDGYAVDLMRGDTCLSSDTYPTLAQAERAADAHKQDVQRGDKSSAPRRAADSAHA